MYVDRLKNVEASWFDGSTSSGSPELIVRQSDSWERRLQVMQGRLSPSYQSSSLKVGIPAAAPWVSSSAPLVVKGPLAARLAPLARLMRYLPAPRSPCRLPQFRSCRGHLGREHSEAACGVSVSGPTGLARYSEQLRTGASIPLATAFTDPYSWDFNRLSFPFSSIAQPLPLRCYRTRYRAAANAHVHADPVTYLLMETSYLADVHIV